MSYQLSNEDLVWKLTPTQFKIAHLSLTLTKKEIAEKLTVPNAPYDENTVGTHLTSVYKTLHLSGHDDEIKRSLLKSQFGSIIERIAEEIKEDYEGEYKRRKKDYWSKQNRKPETALPWRTPDSPEHKEGADTKPPQPRMGESPPAPRGFPRWRRIAGLIFGAFIVIAGFCLLILIALNNMITNILPPEDPLTLTSAYTSTPSLTSTPENTPTPEITPTPVPLPIKEDFSKQYSDLWRVFGNPIITEKVGWYSNYRGVLTAKDGTTATLWIGNTAWTDYIVSSGIEVGGTNILIGVRVEDLNNMVGLACRGGPVCHWVIIDNGIADDIPGEQYQPLYALTITVEGDTFTAIDSSGRSPISMKLILPPKYKGKFSGGGVLLQLNGPLEVDYIQIDRLR